MFFLQVFSRHSSEEERGRHLPQLPSRRRRPLLPSCRPPLRRPPPDNRRYPSIAKPPPETLSASPTSKLLFRLWRPTSNNSVHTLNFCRYFRRPCSLSSPPIRRQRIRTRTRAKRTVLPTASSLTLRQIISLKASSYRAGPGNLQNRTRSE